MIDFPAEPDRFSISAISGFVIYYTTTSCFVNIVVSKEIERFILKMANIEARQIERIILLTASVQTTLTTTLWGISLHSESRFSLTSCINYALHATSFPGSSRTQPHRGRVGEDPGNEVALNALFEMIVVMVLKHLL